MTQQFMMKKGLVLVKPGADSKDVVSLIFSTDRVTQPYLSSGDELTLPIDFGSMANLTILASCTCGQHLVNGTSQLCKIEDNRRIEQPVLLFKGGIAQESYTSKGSSIQYI
jgi:hypothetical protein